MSSIRIAILECDKLLPALRDKYVGYNNIYQNLLNTAAANLQSKPTYSFSAYDVVDAKQYPELEDIDAVFLSGSRYNCYDNDEWILALIRFVNKVLTQNRVRLIGVCFGHQIICRAMGGDSSVGQNEKGWELSVTDISLTPRGKEIFGVSKLAINQFHRDIVYMCPKEVEILGFTDTCELQGIYIYQRLFTIQGHPEFNEEIMKEMLQIRYELGLFSRELYVDAMNRANKPQDGIVVGKAFIEFLTN